MSLSRKSNVVLHPHSTWSIALLITLLLRLLYSGIGVFVTPHLKLDPNVIYTNEFTDNLMPRSAGLGYRLLGVWERFDTLWYINIAQHGYDRPDAIVFYPFYPLLIRLLISLVQQPLAAALLISTISSFFLFWGFQKLLELDLPDETIRRALLIFATWPASFMLFAGYPDSLLTALVIWSVYHARRGRWWQAGLLGFLAGMTKAAGSLVIVPLAIIAWREHKRHLWYAWPALVSMLAPLCYSLYIKLSGYPSISDVYLKYWRTEVSLPWTTLCSSLKQVVGGVMLTDEGGFSPDSLVTFNLMMLVLIFVPAFVRRIRTEYGMYALVTLLLFLTKKTDPLLQSTNRYVLAVFPAFAGWGLLLRNRYLFPLVVLILFLVNIIMLLAFFDWALVC